VNALTHKLGIELRSAQPTLIVVLTLVFGLMVAMLSALPAVAQQPIEEGPEPSKSDAISGRIVNESGQPIANATVFVRAFDSQNQGDVTTTDSEGRFRMSGLQPRAYLVTAFAPLYAQAPRYTANSQPQVYRVGDSVTLVLMKGAVVTGTVTTAAGEPVVAVLVHAHRIRQGDDQPQPYQAQSRQWMTDDRGVYRIYGLAPGTYVIAAGGGGRFSNSDFSNAYETDAPTYAPSSRRNSAREIVLRADEEVTNVDIRYRAEPGFTISGSVSGPKTAVEPSGFIISLSPINSRIAQENLNAYQPLINQLFNFYGVADGDYQISAQSYLGGESYLRGDWAVSEPQRIKVRGADLTGINLITKPLGSITGRITLEGSNANQCKGKRRPIFSETVITPSGRSDESNTQPSILRAVGGPATPKEEGAFTLRNLAPDQYSLNALFFAKYWYLRSIILPPTNSPQAKGPSAERLFDAAQNWITIKPGDRVSGLVITLAEGAASFQGQIKNPEGEKQPPRLSVFLVPAELESAKDVLRFFTTPATDGTFQIDNLPPGRYWAIARPIGDSEPDTPLKLRLPDQAEARAKLSHEGAATKTEIELKPCQNVTNYSLPVMVP
jgi:Carboxypeptidase regulatory-like domain